MGRKIKGFNKPVKYIWSGRANTTKTKLAERTGLTVFETDGLKCSEALDISKYDLSKEIIIVGGKHYHLLFPITDLLIKHLQKDYQIILVHLSKWN